MTEKAGTDGIEATLKERSIQHGPFDNHAHIETRLRRILEDEIQKSNMSQTQYIGLGMIMHKIARILNGGNQHSDTWHDIAGYAILVEKSILDE